MKWIGVVDTMFARVDLGSIARRALGESGTGFRVDRRTVPGIKDLPMACHALFDEGADLCLALGMPGRAEYDRTCAHEASTALQAVALRAGRPIVECFVFETEADGDRALERLARARAEAHARNAYAMLFRPRDLAARAGSGRRQGFADAGPLRRRRPAGSGA